MTCQCGRTVEATCSWPIQKYVSIPVSELKPGDFVCRWGEANPRNGSTAQVTDILWFHGFPTVTIWVKPAMKLPREVKVNYRDHASPRIRALRMAPCGAGVCEMHGRDPADGYRLCDEHANAWERVA